MGAVREPPLPYGEETGIIRAHERAFPLERASLPAERPPKPGKIAISPGRVPARGNKDEEKTRASCGDGSSDSRGPERLP